MKRKNNIAAQASKNPSVVLAAFAEETEYVLDLDGAILLESLGCAFITGGGSPGLRDTLMAMLVMTDIDAVRKAMRTPGGLQKLLDAASKGRRLAHIMGQADKIAAALEASLAPVMSGATSATEKKSSAAPDGGSP